MKCVENKNLKSQVRFLISEEKGRKVLVNESLPDP